MWQVVVSNIFEAAFVNEGTREALCRNGRDLLATVASTHPPILSHLLTATQVCWEAKKSSPFLYFPLTLNPYYLLEYLYGAYLCDKQLLVVQSSKVKTYIYFTDDFAEQSIFL